MVTKKAKQNRYKPAPRADNAAGPSNGPRSKSVFRILMGIALMAVMSLGAIYGHDVVVQTPFFTIQSVTISGTQRVTREELLALTSLTQESNLFDIRLDTIEKELVSHPWVSKAMVNRRLFSTLSITILEEEPLAIVNIENLADIVINTQGKPFKEYEPAKDNLYALPVITGMDLSLSNNTYIFEGELFNSVMDLLKIQGLGQIHTIMGDENIGISIKTLDIYNKSLYNQAVYGYPMDHPMNNTQNPTLVPIKLGLDRFEEKLAKAKEISRYMEANYPDKTILAMDLYNIDKIFIKTENTLHNTLEKGV